MIRHRLPGRRVSRLGRLLLNRLQMIIGQGALGVILFSSIMNCRGDGERLTEVFSRIQSVLLIILIACLTLFALGGAKDESDDDIRWVLFLLTGTFLLYGSPYMLLCVSLDQTAVLPIIRLPDLLIFPMVLMLIVLFLLGFWLLLGWCCDPYKEDD